MIIIGSKDIHIDVDILSQKQPISYFPNLIVFSLVKNLNSKAILSLYF